MVEAGPTATVAQLVEALDPSRDSSDPRSIRVERSGAVLAPSRTLAELDLRSGDRVTIAELTPDTVLHEGADPSSRPSAALRFLTGPLAGRTFQLDAGTTTVGRAASNDLALADPGLSRHHATLAVDPSAVVVTDLGATNGIRIEGLPIEGPTALVSGQRLLLGQSWVAVDHHPVPAYPVDGRLRFDRPQRLVSAYQGRIYQVPAPPIPPEGGGRLGPLASRSHHRQAAQAYEQILDRVVADLAAGRREERERRLVESPSIDDVLRAARARTRLWERRLTDPDVLQVRLGLAELPTRHRVEIEPGGDPTLRARVDRLPRTYATIDGVPATVDLGRPGGLTLRGPRDRLRALAASVVGQLVGLNPPDRLGVILFGDAIEAWDWLKWLPHADILGDGQPPTGPFAIDLVSRMLDADRAGESGVSRPPYVLVVVDDSAALREAGPGAGSGSPLAAELVRLMAQGADRGLHPLLLADDAQQMPLAASGLFGSTMTFTGTAGRLLLRTDTPQLVEPVVLEEVQPEAVIELARLMAALELSRSGSAPSQSDRVDTGGTGDADTDRVDTGGTGGTVATAESDPVNRLVVSPLRLGPLPAAGIEGSLAPGVVVPLALGSEPGGDVAADAASPETASPDTDPVAGQGPPDLFDLPRSSDDSRLVVGRFRMSTMVDETVFAFNPSRDGTLGLIGSTGPDASACLLTVASASTRIDGPVDQFPMLFGLGTDDSLDPLVLLPNVCGLAGDDPTEAIETLSELEQLMDDRMQAFDEAEVQTIDEFRRARPDESLRRVLVLIDGLGRLADVLEPDFPGRTREVVGQLLEIGSGLGLHLVFSAAGRGEVDPLLIPKVGRWLDIDPEVGPGRIDLDGADVRFAVPGGSWDPPAIEAGMARLASEAGAAFTRPVPASEAS